MKNAEFPTSGGKATSLKRGLKEAQAPSSSAEALPVASSRAGGRRRAGAQGEAAEAVEGRRPLSKGATPMQDNKGRVQAACADPGGDPGPYEAVVKASRNMDASPLPPADEYCPSRAQLLHPSDSMEAR